MKHLLYVCLPVFMLFTACNYLDMVPEKDIETVETIFEKRVNADEWLCGTYQGVIALVSNIGYNGCYLGADEFTAGEYLRNQHFPIFPGFKISEGLQMSQDPYCNIWDKGNGMKDQPSFYASIRSCNTFLEHIDDVYNMEEYEKRQWKAEVKALKAYIYFELVRNYGPIVLVPKNIDVDVDISVMQQQRMHVDTCFKEIVRLLDEAAEHLLYENEKNFDRVPYFSKEAALALKARVLLYAASPLFNGNEFYSDFKGKNGEPLFSTQYDPEKWKLAAEAADVAAAACERAGHKLYRGTGNKSTELLNTMYDVEFSVHSRFDNSEFVLAWKQGTPAYHELCMPKIKIPAHEENTFYGSLSPSMKMVEMYYTENGLPIDADNTWDYAGRYQMSKEASARYNKVVPLNTDVLQLHLRREPRFYACIAADRTYWQRGPEGGWVDNNLLVEAYKDEAFGTREDIITSNSHQNINGYWMKKFTYSDLATRGYRVSPDETLPIIRLAEVYLIQAEAWNEYEGPSSKVYDPLNKVRERAGVKDVVTAWRSYSKTPEKVDTKEGMRDIIRHEINIELAFEGHRFWNLRRWKVAHEVLNEKLYGWNVLGETARSFYNNFEGPMVVWSKCKFTAPRDYLAPIRAEEVLISTVVQNPGW